MSVKQDRTYARTAQDIERKYSFGKSFADMLGLINDNRDHVDKVESSLKDGGEISTRLMRDTEKLVFEVMQSGVDESGTKIGYTLGYNGFEISKSGEEMTNILDHKGMRVLRDADEILTADNKGVNAVNLHAKTYLIIGGGDGRSRFEDYDEDGEIRTGCYWIGG